MHIFILIKPTVKNIPGEIINQEETLTNFKWDLYSKELLSYFTSTQTYLK